MDFTSFYHQNNKNLLAYAVQNGLQQADAADVVQETWITFNKALEAGKVDTTKNVPAYLYRLLKWRIIDKSRSNNCLFSDKITIGEDNNMDEFPAISKNTEEKERKKSILLRAIKAVKPFVSKNYFTYFIEQTFNGKDAETMFQQYGVKKDHAYLAKCRVGQKVVAAAKLILANGV